MAIYCPIDFEDYQRNHAQELEGEHELKYTGKIAAFRTLMEVEEQFTNEG